MELAEFILKILILATLCIGILGFVLQDASFRGCIENYESDRLAIDLMHALAAAPCLTVQENGEARKGLLDGSKLDNMEGSQDFCISIAKKWGAEVSVGERSWKFGTASMAEISAEGWLIPVAVRINGETLPGKIAVKVEEPSEVCPRK